MTTTELITMLQKNEKGGITGKPRVINIQIGCDFFPRPNIVINSNGDGIAGAEICLKIVGRMFNSDEDEALDELITKKQALDIICANNKSDKMTLACYDDLIDQIYNAVAWNRRADDD